VISRIKAIFRKPGRAAKISRLDLDAARLGFDLVPVHHEYAGCPNSVTYVACESYAEGYQRAKSKYHYPTEQE